MKREREKIKRGKKEAEPELERERTERVEDSLQ